MAPLWLCDVLPELEPPDPPDGWLLLLAGWGVVVLLDVVDVVVCGTLTPGRLGGGGVLTVVVVTPGTVTPIDVDVVVVGMVSAPVAAVGPVPAASSASAAPSTPARAMIT